MNEAKTALVSLFEEFGRGDLRDVWLFDQQAHEALYVRDDVQEKLASVDVEKFIDNERYGFITQETYELLYYADYRYTVRGFATFEQFRTFFTDPSGARVGVFASYDQSAGGRDFASLADSVSAVVSSRSGGKLTPE